MGRSELIFCLAAGGESAAQTFDVVVSPRARQGIPQASREHGGKKNKAIWKSELWGWHSLRDADSEVWTGRLRASTPPTHWPRAACVQTAGETSRADWSVIAGIAHPMEPLLVPSPGTALHVPYLRGNGTEDNVKVGRTLLAKLGSGTGSWLFSF